MEEKKEKTRETISAQDQMRKFIDECDISKMVDISDSSIKSKVIMGELVEALDAKGFRLEMDYSTTPVSWKIVNMDSMEELCFRVLSPVLK